MELEQIVCSVLLISSSDKVSSSLYSLLPSAYFFPVHKVKNIAAAKRMLAERTYDYVIINSPLMDESGIEFAIDVSTEKNIITLLLATADTYEEIFEKVSRCGVFTVAKPVTRQAFEMAMRWLTVVRMRTGKSEAKTSSLEEKIKEIRMINRAKLLLISKEKMEEDQAHRYIEKQAMDRCRTRGEIASELIARYE